MEQVFQSFQELLNFDFSELQPQKTNYLKLIPADGILPKIRKSFEKDMRFEEKNDKTQPQITLEICPRWVAVIIYEHAYAKKNEFPLENGYDSVLAVIQEVFCAQRPG